MNYAQENSAARFKVRNILGDFQFAVAGEVPCFEFDYNESFERYIGWTKFNKRMVIDCL